MLLVLTCRGSYVFINAYDMHEFKEFASCADTLRQSGTKSLQGVAVMIDTCKSR